MSAISGISTTSPYLYGHIASGNRLMSAADGAAVALPVAEGVEAHTVVAAVADSRRPVAVAAHSPRCGAAAARRPVAAAVFAP